LNWDGRKYLRWGIYKTDLQPENAQVWVLKNRKSTRFIVGKKIADGFLGITKI
jgi:hypothetical protein